MKTTPKWNWWALLPLLIVFGLALGARCMYLIECTDHGQRDAALEVQGAFPLSHHPAGTSFRSRATPTQLDNLVAKVSEQHEFACLAPLSDKDGPTAHTAPGFPWLHGMLVAYFVDSADSILRWLNCALGGLTIVCYFLFAWRVFHSTLVASIAGLFIAIHPFSIINTAELNDGVLVSFLLSMCLLVGTRGIQEGGAFTGLLFGILLAALVMVRAALLPFATVALLGFLWQSRHLPMGWFVGFLALIGFVNGIAPWTLRNYQLLERPVPIADSTYLHLWMGNNPHFTGATLSEPVLRESLRTAMTEKRFEELLAEDNRKVRYNLLAPEVWREVQEQPTKTVTRRISSALAFMMGERWFRYESVSRPHEPSETSAPCPEWLTDNVEVALQGTLLAVFILAFLGWRWSALWRDHGCLAAIAMLWIPLPFILSHAEHLSGPRLPLDGVLLCYAAFAVVSLVPGLVKLPRPPAASKKENASR